MNKQSMNQHLRHAQAILTCAQKASDEFLQNVGTDKAAANLESILHHIDSLKYVLTDARRAVRENIKANARLRAIQ